MSKATVIGAVVIVGVGVVGGGGYYYATQQAEKKFQEKIALIKENFPQATLTYESHHIGVFSQEVTMDKVTFKDQDGTVYTADKVNTILGSGNMISKLSVDKFAVTKKRKAGFTINHIDLEDAKAEPGWIVRQDNKMKQIFPSKISFGLLNLQNIEIGVDDKSKFTLAQFQIKNYGLGKKTDILLNDLSTNERNIQFKAASIKLNQINQAEIAQNIENWVTDNRNRYQSSEATFKRVLQNISEVQFALFSIDNLQYSIKYNGTLKIAHYELKDYGLGKKTSQLLKDFAITDIGYKDGFAKIALVDLNGIDLAMMMKVYQGIGFSGGYDQLVASIAECQQEYMKQVGTQKNHVKITGVDIAVDQQKLSLGSFAAISQVNVNGAGDVTYTLDGLSFTLPPYNRDVQIFKDLGYNQISVSGVLKGQYEPETKLLSMSLDKLSLKDIGQVSATLKANMPIGLNYNRPAALLTNPNIKLKEMNIQVQAAGFLDKFIKKISTDKGISEDEVKKSLVAQAKEVTEKLRELNPTFAEDAVKAFTSVVNDPQTTEFDLSAKPTTPVAMTDLSGKNEQEVFDLFNWKIQSQTVK